MNKRVVITGVGVFSPIGNTRDEFWQSLQAGKSGVTEVTLFDTEGEGVTVGGEVKDFQARDYIPKQYRKAIKMMSRDVVLGVAASLLAIEDAGIITEEKRVDPTRLGISFGCGFISSDINEMGETFAEAVDTETDTVDWSTVGETAMGNFVPLWLLKYLPNMPACHTSIFCDAQGPNNSVTSGDAASVQAIGEGCRVLERGWADAMICGGVDGKVNPVSYARYVLNKGGSRSRGNPEEVSKPFDKARGGFVPAEGAGAMIVEDYEYATERGANILAEITGYGSASDAYAIDKIHPDGRGLQLAMKNALRDAGLEPGDVDVIFACANGSEALDRAESRAINAVFVNGPSKVPVTSTKSMLGYTSSATGAMDVLAAVGAIMEGAIPPTINYSQPDPECDVNVVAPSAKKTELNNVLVNCGGLGGQFASMVITRFK